MITRRGFLRSAASALLLPVAPAIVKAESLMAISPLRILPARELVDYDISRDAYVYHASIRAAKRIYSASILVHHQTSITDEMRATGLQKLYAHVQSETGTLRGITVPDTPEGIQTLHDFRARRLKDSGKIWGRHL